MFNELVTKKASAIYDLVRFGSGMFVNVFQTDSGSYSQQEILNEMEQSLPKFTVKPVTKQLDLYGEITALAKKGKSVSSDKIRSFRERVANRQARDRPVPNLKEIEQQLNYWEKLNRDPGFFLVF